MDEPITSPTLTPPALDALNEITDAVAAVRAAHLMTRLAARPGPPLRWTVNGTTLVGRPEPDATEDQAAEAVREWGRRLQLESAGGAAAGTVEGINVAIHSPSP